MTHLKQLICGLFLISAAPLGAAENHDHAAHMGHANDCADAALACSDKAQPFFDREGRLWLVWQGGGRIAVASSTDGKSFTAPVFITPEPIAADVGADSRPQIIRDGSGVISVIYSVMQKSGYNGRIYLSQSKDGGVSFSPPRPVTDDAASQRFPALAVDKSGRALAVWIDKRTARAAKPPYDGAALAFAWIDGAGAQPTSIMRENSCECCRVAITFDTAGNPAATWRQIFPGMIRDHAVTTFKDGMPGPMYRVAEDKWNIDACPHHGPAIAISAGGAYHVAWFTEGDARQGLFYATSRDGGAHFTPPAPIGAADKNPGRAQLLAIGKDVWLAWQEFDGTTVSILAKKRVGTGWAPSRVLATTQDASDLPVLIANGAHPYLSWLTAKEGYRLISLEAAP
jgi:hypothetical protein